MPPPRSSLARRAGSRADASRNSSMPGSRLHAVATPSATTQRPDLPPELDDPLFRTALGQLDAALEEADVMSYAAE